ncbi:MAG TPA: hypothetical protein VJZ00_21425 [Thermoanaerobaculia bacterium]|nr:hypothetical protein [Thermoanaerobaculia bacterium]
MVDNVNPTSQFHPYQPQNATPQTGTGSLSGALGGILGKLGMSNTDVRGQLNKARGVARDNSSLVLGGLAALAIGAGLMRKRGLSR